MRGWSAAYSLWRQRPRFGGVEDGVLGANLFTPSASGHGEYKDYEVEVSYVRGSKKTAARDVASPAASCRACQREEGEDDDPLLPVFCDEMVSDPIGLASWAALVGCGPATVFSFFLSSSFFHLCFPF
jgi:hypothetical protein